MKVNGVSVGYANFNSTGAWDKWREDTLQNVYLHSSVNTIEVRASSNRGGPNLDHIYTIADEPVHEAEHYSLISGSGFTTVHSGYTSDGFIDFGGQNSSIEWKHVALEKCGTYRFTFRYATPSSSRTSVVEFRDSDTGAYLGGNQIAFSALGGGWTNWGFDSVTRTLTKKFVDIKVRASTSNGGPNLDHMQLKRLSSIACAPL